MLAVLREHYIISGLILVLFILSLLSLTTMGFLYQNMIKETHNMSSTEHKMLKICKLKFSNYFELHDGVPNIAVFVDKFMNSISIGGFPVKNLYHLSGQFLLLAIFVAGAGACRAIAQDKTLDQIVPYYVVSFLMLYFYFSVTALVDMKGKRLILKTNLIDYLENVMSVRIPQTKKEQTRLDRLEAEAWELEEHAGKKLLWNRKEAGRTAKIWDSLTPEEELELECLMKELL